MTKENGKPQIRFAKFKDTWEQRKLGELVDVCSGRDYKHLSEGTIPVYGTGGYMLSVNDALSYDRDAIGIGRKGTIDRPYILKAPFWTVDTLFYAVPREKVDLNFAFDIFQNIDWKKKDESTGVPSLSKTAINDIDVLAPKHGEQQTIGQFFSAIDHLITLHQRKYDKLTKVKKSMLEKMFPKNGTNVPEIRFKGFTDAWEQRKFSELYAKSSEKNDGSIGMDKNITVATMQFKEDVKVSSVEYLKTYYTFNIGDIAFEGHQSKDFRYGRFVENDIGNGIVSHIFAVFRPIQEYDLHFWKYAINNEMLMQRILSRSTKASTMMHDLVTNDFLNETFLVPSLDEQKHIGAFFDNLDHLITLHQRKLDKLKILKKACLEKMFV